MELQCKVQNYDWGKIGSESMVARLISSADPNIEITEMPYAEFWMGTHPNGPAVISERNVLLSEYIVDNLDAIGSNVKQQFGATVPFLLKVLSIRKPLSIQAHPNKDHAKVLHETLPHLYKDPNHKPELAIALTPFEALCGFRPVSEIKMFVEKLPELQKVLCPNAVNNLLSTDNDAKTALRDMFNSLMTCNTDTLSMHLNELLSRLGNEDEANQGTLLFPLIQRLNKEFPGDVGCWVPYFLNYIQLKAGEAIFLGPNLPHAYLSGDCVECMACSDNVVRAGLTSKLIDVPTLVHMLDYTSYKGQDMLFNPQLEDGNSCIWKPPVQDFAVVKIKLNDSTPYNTRLRNSPSIFVVTSGTGIATDTEPITLRPGVVIFLKALRQLTLTTKDSLELYQAICNVE